MPTPRSCAACVATETELVVAGGYGREECRFVREPVDTVEVMNISTKEWFTVCPLPKKCAEMSAAVCNNIIFLAGGDDIIISPFSNSNSIVFLCTLPTLLLPTTCGSSEQQMGRVSVWKEICNLPVKRSTLVSFNDSVLAVGGKCRSRYDLSRNIYMYNFTSNSWTLVSQINHGRFNCLAVSLPEDILVIVGGHLTNSVEILE